MHRRKANKEIKKVVIKSLHGLPCDAIVIIGGKEMVIKYKDYTKLFVLKQMVLDSTLDKIQM